MVSDPGPVIPSAHAKLDPFAAVSAGWSELWRDPWPAIGLAVVLVLIQLVCEVIPFLNIVLCILILPALYGGAFAFAMQRIRGQGPAFEVGFSGFQRWASVTGAMLLAYVITFLAVLPLGFAMATTGILGAIMTRIAHPRDLSMMLPMGPAAGLVMLAVGFPCAILATFLTLRLYMTGFVAMDTPALPAVECVRRSWRLTGGNTWRMLGLSLLTTLLIMVGMLCCVVGCFPAIMIALLAFAHAHDQLQRRDAALRPAG